MQDISGKPLQTALLATSSSGVVSKDCPMHSNSERSLNSPVMSGHSLSGSGLSGGVGGAVGGGSSSGGRSQSQQHGRPSSLADAMSAGTGGSGGRPVGMVDEHALHRRQQQQHHRGQAPAVGADDDDDSGSSTSSDESGNDSFTCSEIEYDNNSVSGEKLSDVIFNKIGSAGKSASGSSDRDSQRRGRLPLPCGTPPLSPSGGPAASPRLQQQQQLPHHHQQPHHQQPQQQQQQDRDEQRTAAGYDTFDSSFRGSLSTLVASDDDGPMYRGNVRTPNDASESSSIPVGLGWDYLLNWAPSGGHNMRPIMQPPPSPPPYAGDRDHDRRLSGHHSYRHHGPGPGHQQLQQHAVGPGQSAADSMAAARTTDGTSSSSRQSPKSPEEYV